MALGAGQPERLPLSSPESETQGRVPVGSTISQVWEPLDQPGAGALPHCCPSMTLHLALLRGPAGTAGRGGKPGPGPPPTNEQARDPLLEKTHSCPTQQRGLLQQGG